MSSLKGSCGPVLAVLAILLLSGPALAAGLPEGWTLGVEVQISGQREIWKKVGKGPRKSTRKPFEYTETFRFFSVQDRLIVSEPDFGYPVTIDGRQVKKNAIAATAGSFHCIEVRAVGENDTHCASYKPTPDGVTVTLRYERFGAMSTGTSESTYRLTVSGQSCRVELLAYRDESRQTMVPVGTESGSNRTGRLAGSSCRLIKGRKAF